MYLKWLGVLESQAKEDQPWEVSGKPTLWQVVTGQCSFFVFWLKIKFALPMAQLVVTG